MAPIAEVEEQLREEEVTSAEFNAPEMKSMSTVNAISPPSIEHNQPEEIQPDYSNEFELIENEAKAGIE